ncbi:MAG: hypothetical protein ACQETE_13385 [Bacteroidota bacterium]
MSPFITVRETALPNGLTPQSDIKKEGTIRESPLRIQNLRYRSMHGTQIIGLYFLVTIILFA